MGGFWNPYSKSYDLIEDIVFEWSVIKRVEFKKQCRAEVKGKYLGKCIGLFYIQLKSEVRLYKSPSITKLYYPDCPKD